MTNNNVASNVTITTYEQYLLAVWKAYGEFPAAATKTVPVTLHMVGLLANTTVIIYLIHSRKYHLAIFTLLTSLAICDWLHSFGAIIFVIFIMPDLVFVLGAKQICRAIAFIVMLSYCTSICHVMALAALRFYQLVHPLHAKVHVTTGCVFKCCLAMWLFCVPLAIQDLINHTVTLIPYNENKLLIWHFVGNAELNAMFVSIFGMGIPLVVIVLLHLIKVFKVTKASRNSENERRSSSSRTVTLLIMCFVISILPKILHTCYHKVLGYPYHTIHLSLRFYSGLISSANSIVDPFLYLLGSKEIRQEIYKMVRLTAMRKA